MLKILFYRSSFILRQLTPPLSWLPSSTILVPFPLYLSSICRVHRLHSLAISRNSPPHFQHVCSILRFAYPSHAAHGAAHLCHPRPYAFVQSAPTLARHHRPHRTKLGAPVSFPALSLITSATEQYTPHFSVPYLPTFHPYV